MSVCKVCGASATLGAAHCDRCWNLINSVGVEEARRRIRNDPSEVTSPKAASEVKAPSSLVDRYRDGYRVAGMLVGFGNILKIVGGIAAGLILLLSLVAATDSFAGGAAFFVGIVFALIVGGFFSVCGVLVTAQGQILRATLDGAVASSPFLSNPERAVAMGLPPAVAVSTQT